MGHHHPFTARALKPAPVLCNLGDRKVFLPYEAAPLNEFMHAINKVKDNLRVSRYFA